MSRLLIALFSVLVGPQATRNRTSITLAMADVLTTACRFVLEKDFLRGSSSLQKAVGHWYSGRGGVHGMLAMIALD